MIDENKNPWQLKTSKEIYDNPWINLVEDQVVNPGGGDGVYGKVHFKNLAIGIIPVDDQLNTWLVGQWRYPLEEYSWEIPMGGGPIGVDRLLSAQRELKEETGLEAGQWEEVAKVHLSNSVSDEVGYVFIAQGLTQGEMMPEETEQLQLKKVRLIEAITMCEEGRITDSLSVIGLLHVARKLKL